MVGIKSSALQGGPCIQNTDSDSQLKWLCRGQAHARVGTQLWKRRHRLRRAYHHWEKLRGRSGHRDLCSRQGRASFSVATEAAMQAVTSSSTFHQVTTAGLSSQDPRAFPVQNLQVTEAIGCTSPGTSRITPQSHTSRTHR